MLKNTTNGLFPLVKSDKEFTHVQRKKRLEHKLSIVLFITSYFTRFPYVSGPIGERYVGLYNTFSRMFSSRYDFYWYDEAKMKLHKFIHGRYALTDARFLPIIILDLIRESIVHHKDFVVIIPYPAGCYKPSFLISSISLSAFRTLGFMKIILDVIDVPAFVGRVGGNWKVPLFFVHEVACFRMASRLIVNSPGWSEYFLNRGVKKEKIWMIPMGSFHRLIAPTYRPASDSFNLLYVGSVVRGRGIESFVECVKEMRKKRHNMRLLIATAGVPKVPLPESEWLIVFSEVATYLDLINLLSRADAFVIPYPPNSYWDRTFIAKMSVYMAAGKPIISTNLLQTKRVIREWNCGLVVHNCMEMEELITKLSKDKKLSLLLGKNARTAAEKVYNWETCALRLNEFIENFLFNNLDNACSKSDQPLGGPTKECP